MTDSYAHQIGAVPIFGPFLAVLATLVRIGIAPVVTATAGGHPWIEARDDQSGTALVWQSAGRYPRRFVVDEIADALERGEARPQPLSARWIGFHSNPTLG